MQKLTVRQDLFSLLVLSIPKPFDQLIHGGNFDQHDYQVVFLELANVSLGPHDATDTLLTFGGVGCWLLT